MCNLSVDVVNTNEQGGGNLYQLYPVDMQRRAPENYAQHYARAECIGCGERDQPKVFINCTVVIVTTQSANTHGG